MAVVVTGLGAVSCLGNGVPALWDGLLRADFEPSPAPDDCGLPGRPSLYPAAPGHPPGTGRATAMALAAVAEAVAEAGLTPENLTDAGLGVGTSLGDVNLAEADGSTAVAEHTVAAGVAARFGIGGPNHTLSTACSAGVYTVSWGAELIETGQAETVVVCGADVFSRVAVGTLHRFELLDRDRCRPFDAERGGMVTGEGAAAVVLESSASARGRGVPVIAGLAGYGWSCDAHHPMAPEPSGGQLRRAARHALSECVEPPGAVVLHRNGVTLNDEVETAAIAGAIGDRGGVPADVAGYAPKAVLGHTAGAAGVFGCVVAALILRHRLVPPNGNVTTLDQDCPLGVPLTGPVPLARPAVLVSGTGFGGNNAALALRRTA